MISNLDDLDDLDVTRLGETIRFTPGEARLQQDDSSSSAWNRRIVSILRS